MTKTKLRHTNFLIGILLTIGHPTTNLEAQNLKAETVDSILFDDILPPSSLHCRHKPISLPNEETHAENPDTITETSIPFATFDFKPSLFTKWNKHSANYEPRLFQAEIHHDDPDPTRTWTMRIGQGGNIYSFQGAFGEAMPPQKNHHVAPFMDEVWQMVSVNQIQNRDPNSPPYFIHQAGTYTKDGKHTENGPFYSPSIAQHCESNENEGIFQCCFASWGQHAHLPTIFHSSALYFNRYQDCGDGIIEITSVIQNIAEIAKDENDKENEDSETLTMFSVPWGGIRTSTLKSLLLSDPSGEYHLQFPLQQFGSESKIPTLKETGGYTTFAQHIKPSSLRHTNDTDCANPDDETWMRFDMPEAGNDGRALPQSSANKKRQERINLKKEYMVKQRMMILQQNNINQTDSDTCNKKEDQNDQLSELPNDILGDANEDIQNKIMKEGLEELRLIVKSKNACQESKPHTKQTKHRVLKLFLKPTVEIKTGDRMCSLKFINSRTGDHIDVKRILHWSWDGNQLFFTPEDEDVTAEVFNDLFQAGDEIKVTYADLGKEAKENLSLTFVHGIDSEKKGSRIRFGTTDLERDYTVYTVNVRFPLRPGYTYVNRQYVITDKFEGVKERAAAWVPETYEKVIPSGNHQNREIRLISSNDGTLFGASFGNQSCQQEGTIVCIGNSTPQPGLKALFYIKCHDSHYVGHDRYYFAPPSDSTAYGKTVIRAYACHDDDLILRPEWKLLGYFEDQSCGDLERMKFESTFCTPPSSPAPEVESSSQMEEL